MMSTDVQRQMEVLQSRAYRTRRVTEKENITHKLTQAALQLRSAERFAYVLDREEPVFHGEDRFGFNQYWAVYPQDDRSGEGGIGNLTADYETALSLGVNGIMRQAKVLRDQADEQGQMFYDSVITCMERPASAWCAATVKRRVSRASRNSPKPWSACPWKGQGNTMRLW